MNKLEKTKIMILGTFHMAGSSDMFNVDSGNIGSEKNQKDIKAIIEKVIEFQPTKLAFEIESKNNDFLNQAYKKYLSGDFNLSEKEVHQIGFRLGKALNHKEIFAIDWMERGVAKHPYGYVYDYAKDKEPDIFKLINEGQGDKSYSSIIEALIDINKEESISQNSALYLNYARLGMDDDYVGLGWLMWWYQRNLIIFSNLSKLIENQEDRILLLIGGDHIGILRGFLEKSNLFEIVSPLGYLV